MPDYYCSVCSAGFSDLEPALNHLMTHNVLQRRCLKPECHCSKTHHLIRHTALKHSSLCHYQCHECPRRFVRQCDLDRHVTSRHIGVPSSLYTSSALPQQQRTAAYEALLHNSFWSAYASSSSANGPGNTLLDVKTLATTKGLSLNRPTTSNALNEFIASELQPDKNFNSTMSKTVDEVCSYFQKEMSPNQIIKGGSMGKGTAVKGKADIDLLLILNDVVGAEQLRSRLPYKTAEILECLRKDNGNFVIKRGSISKTSFSVQFTVVSAENQEIKVDLLPTFVVKDKKNVYEQMNRGPRALLPYYSAALAKLQIEFVSPIPANVKNLIRLVKYWRKEYIDDSETNERLPTSYVLELITIYLWEKKGEPRQFDTVKAFHSVMKTLAEVDKLNDVIWEENYFKAMIPAEVRRGRPLVMDPANPFNNVCSTFGWEKVKSKAQEALRRSMLRDVSSDNWM